MPDPIVLPQYAQEVKDQASAAQAIQALQVLLLQAAVTSTSHDFEPRDVATVTYGATTTTIDYGATDVQCSDGRHRRGKIEINYAGSFADSGYVSSMTFNNFSQGNITFTGTMITSNLGTDSGGHPQFSIVSRISFTSVGGKTTTVDWRQTMSWAEGYQTKLALWDDLFFTSGAGITTNGTTTTTVNILSNAPLRTTIDCHWIKQGSIQCTLPNGQMALVDYGANAQCDNNCTLTMPDSSYTDMTLP